MIKFSNPRIVAEFDDWPSGAKRVRCTFKVEYDLRRGWRVGRTTTGKPKFTTYSDGPACIVDGDDGRTYVLAAGFTYGSTISVTDSDLVHSVPADRLGHPSSYVRKESDPELYAELLALVTASGAMALKILEK